MAIGTENNLEEIKNRKAKSPSPTPVDREVKLNKDDVLISITDTKGVIEYCNEEFVDVSGYEEYELVGSAHNIVRHPDMPRVIFKEMWSRIQRKENIIAIIKNMSKTGRYYWVMTDFIVKENEKGEITGYKALRKPAPKKAIEAVIPLYKKLCEIEAVKGIGASEKFIEGYFDSKNTNYNNFIEKLIIDNATILISSDNKVIDNSKEKKKGSFFKWFFGLDGE